MSTARKQRAFSPTYGVVAALALSAASCTRESGGPVSGSLYFQEAVGETFKTGERILLPDIEVFLRDTASGAETPLVKTDSFGRYRFPLQSPGSYELQWKEQRGWAAGKLPDAIVIANGPRFPDAGQVQPNPDTGVIFGRVTLGDGSTPWSYDELFKVNHTATVTVLNAARTVTLAGPLSTNAEGRYAVPGLRRGESATIQAQSQASVVIRAVDAAQISVGNPVSPTDVQLPNKLPEIVALTVQVGGVLVRTAAPGETVKIVAETRDLNGDPLQHDWAALDGNGTVVPAGPSSANWTLPGLAGRYSAYLQVADGRGGFARQRIDFETARTTTTFSGRALEKGTGSPVPGAEVVANGKSATTDTNGFFSVVTPLDARYVLSIGAAGFATFSRVVDEGMTGQTWPLVRAQSESVDPTKVIDLVDQRPELERKQMRGTHIRVPANSLVDANGAPATGPLTAYLATLDIRDGEAPGDWGAMLGGKETNLISYGATFVEFRDGAGAKFNLANGAQAEVEMFAPSTLLAAAPPNSKLWSYDVADGYWKPSGAANFKPASGSFEGRVEHFSTINTDVEKDDDACLKVLLYPPIPTGVKLRVTDPTGTAFSQAFEGVLDAGINAVFRLPATTNVRLELFDADNSPYDGTVLLEEVPGVPLPANVVNTGPAIPSGGTPFPPEPYESCKLVILREANAPTANTFLAFKGAGDLARTNGYYAAIDPNGERLTLGAWWSKNGFTFDASGIPTNAVRTSYLNFNDLGSGRDMYFLQRTDGTVAAYVTNYGLFNQDHGNADLASNRTTPGATVAMEYGPVEGQGAARIVKFFVFLGADFAANAPRAAAADLDGFGPKFVPNLCLNCHGGNYFPANPAAPTFAEVNMGAAFRELDITTYKFPGGRLSANNTEKDAFRQQNLIVKGADADTLSIQPIKDLIAGWYPGSSIEQDNTFTPPGWQGSPRQNLYHDVVKSSCRTCHVALDSNATDFGIGWTSYGQLKRRRNILSDFVLCDSRFMPHSVTTYRNFWLSASPHRPAVLRDFNDGSDWAALGPCQ